jgi:hypothetical protein
MDYLIPDAHPEDRNDFTVSGGTMVSAALSATAK